MATAMSKEGGHRGIPPGAWAPALEAARTLGVTGLAVAPQPVLPPEPPSPTPDPLALPLAPHRGPAPFFFTSLRSPCYSPAPPFGPSLTSPGARGPSRSQRPQASRSAISAPVAAAATAVAAAMVAPAAQNANYRLGQVTGWVGGAEARGCGLYSGGRSQSGRITSVGAEPMRAPRKLRTWGSKTTDSSQRSRGYRS